MKAKILFIGGTPRGYELLKALTEDGQNVAFAFILKEDGHEKNKASRDIMALCGERSIRFKLARKISLEDIPAISKLKPDVVFVCGWRTIIPAEVYTKVPLGCLAAHDSLLPKYRGFSPLNWAIINGEKVTGVTLFKISDGPVDGGDIFRQKKVKIAQNCTAEDVYRGIIGATIDLYFLFLEAIGSGNIKWKKQDEKKATYTCKRTPEDGKVDWTRSAKKVFDLIRALAPPYPCAWTVFSGEKLYIEEASFPARQFNYSGNIPGRIISITDKGILVLCGKGQVLLSGISDPSGRRIDLKRYFLSIKDTLGG
ncbi:MAG: methionyl-tRNA formyltransferase [Candidatus Omnitrophica bacterium]|nr:methionyl-tRNA formyltransferase [Candidatus Omnitrophota bacterium]